MTELRGRVGAGKVLISLVSAWSAVGPYVFDWNETHIYNPSWPPHAKFHNAQTMSLGVGLAAATLSQLWRRRDDVAAARTAVDEAAVTAALYWLTQISALAYPGSKAVDPPATGTFPQGRAAFPALALIAVGRTLEHRRLRAT